MRVRRSAAGEGWRWFSWSLARMKESILVRGQVVSAVAGAGRARTGWKAHHLRPCSTVRALVTAVVVALAGAARGSGAPMRTHCSRAAIFAAGGFFFGGDLGAGAGPRVGLVRRA